MLVQIPHAFFKKTVKFPLPEEGHYGAGMIFLPVDKKRSDEAVALTEKVIKTEGGKLLGWRDVPVNPDCLGELARKVMPSFKQVFVSFDGISGDALENRLYILRKQLENSASDAGMTINDYYITSLSGRTMVYKGMFVAPQFVTFYPDLGDADFVSALAMVHQRYSTNTFPSWPLAQPFRYMSHNGEINTLRRNVNNMEARQKSLKSDFFGDEITKLFPVILPGGSDSAAFDNVYELLIRGGRSVEHSVMMMVPEAFGSRYHISEDKRSFYEYHAAIMEPWDGPAAILFTDGRRIGGTLDRNGLRPGRYTITKSGKVILASETGVLPVEPEDVLEKGRLSPGKIFVVDTENHRVIKDSEIKSHISRQKPYRRWLSENKIELGGFLGTPKPVSVDRETIDNRLKAFGYDYEDIHRIIIPMAVHSQEPVGSMGNDSPVAVLSRQSQSMYEYFRQLFAQVTNPPIDPYRENLVMSLMSFIGRESNLLDETPQHCRQVKLAHPILTNDDIRHLREEDIEGFPVATVPILFAAKTGCLEKAIDDLCLEVEKKLDEGISLIILSDRGIDSNRAAIPALLAMSAVHHDLVRKGKRHLAAIIMETGEAREVHHFATLVGYGCSGINPYLAFELLADLHERGKLTADLTLPMAIEHYITSVKKGLLKVMSKMGISTIRSYRGAQIYEAVGLDQGFVEKYFRGTASNIGGIGINEVEKDTLDRHNKGYEALDAFNERPLPGGKYHSRFKSEDHTFTAKAIVLLHQAVRGGDYGKYKEYSKEINDTSRHLNTLRGLFRFKKANPIPLDQVEPAESIVKRFVSSAMSFGSISKEAHETIAIAMNRLGAQSNSGEGGEDTARFNPLPNGDSAMSKIKQVASGRFGVDSVYLANCQELQIKMAQGAKPGEGGQLPGHKVDETIARVRHSTPGVMLISPPPHHDIYSIEDLSQLIFDLKNTNPQARVSVKLVSETGVGTVAAGVAKGKADMVLISGCDGGTGASPLSSIKYAGSWWEIGLAETQQVLVMNKLRSRIRVQTDGQLKTGRDVVIAALLGAEEYGFGTCSLVSVGCLMMRKCHTNACPVGVATQDPECRKRFVGKPEHLINFMLYTANEVREYMAELGFKNMDDMIGHVEMLEINDAVSHYKTKGLDFSRVLAKPDNAHGEPLRCTSRQDHDFSLSLDPDLVAKSQPAIEQGKPVKITMPIKNCNRTVGATLSYHISKKHGQNGLPDGSIHVKFDGSAGQSFGAFLARGVTFELEGDSNDYFGKGLSGGRLVLYPPKKAGYSSFRNIITGNVNLFGATAGEAFINGQAGERFCVRNSGALAVVEGVGDHGCEYMTGGRVVILGPTGVNFAAGMSGGIAYVFDENQLFDTRCNLEMVDVEPLKDKQDISWLKGIVEQHVKYTDSERGRYILANWDEVLPSFVRVMPLDYRMALARIRERESQFGDSETMTEEVFN
jgi:glutamate synthase domain-containing protein 2/glutamate synthase domain-containing protein 1/glutamate synthase domain-containing protein 3